ncbi:MAG: helix-turn-helix domain-containing protein, partial [Candidatus Methylomirabilales bacterium]
MVEQLVINVGRKIHELREQRGLTLRQLSKRADVSPSTIQKIEKNQISPSLGTVFRIAKGLEITIESLLDAQGEIRDVVHLPKEKRGTIAVPDL